MPESHNSKNRLTDLALENMQPSTIPTTDMPGPTILMKDIPPLNTNTSESTKNPTNRRKVSTSISNDLETEDVDVLTAKQEKVRKLLEQRYISLGGMLCAVDVYTGMVVAKSAEARSMETVKAARHNRKLWDSLERFVHGGDSLAFFFGHGLMIFAILVHARRIKSTPQIDVLLAMSGYSEQAVMSPPDDGIRDGTDIFAGSL